MQFDSSYITTAGSELFARATASASSNVSHPIVWGSVYTSKTDMRSLTQEEMRALTSIPENERSSSGSVTSARHDVIGGNHIVKLECEINNRQYHGSAYAIGVYAKLDGDSNEVLAAIARVDTNGSTPDIIQQSGEYLAIIDFAIAIRDDQFNIQKVDSSYYASAKSMQDLANRVVTTHVESDVTVGEDQEVRGNKYFIDGITLFNKNNNPFIQITDVYGSQDVFCEMSVLSQEAGIGITFRGDLLNDTDQALAIELDDGTSLYSLSKKRAVYSIPELYVDQVNTNMLVTSVDSITLKSNIVPNDDNVSLGTDTTPFNNIFATNINCKNIESTRGATFNNVTATNLNGAFVNADVQVKVTQMDGVVEKAGNTLNVKGLQTTARGTTGLNRYATMFTDVEQGFRFCCGPDASSSYNDTSLRMSINNTAIKTEVPLYIDKGAELAKDQVLKLNGKVECTTSWTDQVMLAIPKPASEVVDAENKVYTANIPVGGIVLLYDQIGKFGRGTVGIEPGKRFTVGENDMRIAMAIGSGAETSIPNYTWAGNSQDFQAMTGKNKIYAPSGFYVALMGATATSPDHWVAVLALRYDA